MSFDGKQAIVTGAGSGIGAALCRALAAAGADVVCTDVDGDAAERTASALGARARSARLDVTDAAAVQSVVDDVVARTGRLDLMFNNAGIVWGGDTELLTLDQWNAIIDVNIRGVVHGVAAAYPLMVRAGPRPHRQHRIDGRADRGRTDHQLCDDQTRGGRAVAGAAIRSRRARGRRAGVCPSAVETPILDKGAVGGFNGRDYFLQGQGVKTAYDADRLARDTLKAIERNKALLVKPRRAHAQWVIARLAPGLMQRMSIRFIEASGPTRRSNARTFAGQIGLPAAQPGYGKPVAAMDTEFTLTQKRALAIATVLAILFAAFFLRRYFILIVVAAVVAYLFSPLYNRLKKRLGTGASATLTLLAVFASIIVPLGLIGLLAVIQITEMVKSVAGWVERTDLSTLGDKTLKFVNEILGTGAIRGRHSHSGNASEGDNDRRPEGRRVAAAHLAGGRGRRRRRDNRGDPLCLRVHFAADQQRRGAET